MVPKYYAQHPTSVKYLRAKKIAQRNPPFFLHKFCGILIKTRTNNQFDRLINSMEGKFSKSMT